MSFEKKMIKGASWLGIFKLISQLFSWAVTVIVARILVPGDYGLMEMATIITGYAAMFSELGLGSAIIQRDKIDQKDLSSIFWFITAISIFFSIFAFFAAYPTSWIFNQPKVIPVTQSVALLFLISGLQIVPKSLLQRDLKFKQIGFFDLMGVVISSICMLAIAKAGGGVWTLIGGHIIREFVKTIFNYSYCKWRPDFYFKMSSALSYLKFGVVVSLSGSFYYMYNKSDRFFAGKFWTPGTLGLYTFALELASMPTNKIVTLINQVSYAGFAKLQNDKEEFNRFYLNVVKLISIIVVPLYIGLYFVGENAIHIFLNEKWFGMIFVFKGLCIIQIVTSLLAVNNYALTAKGNPYQALVFNAILTITLVPSFYFATIKGFETILIPWFSVYLILSLGLVFHTLKKLNISISLYLSSLKIAFISVLSMSLALYLIKTVPTTFINFPGKEIFLLIIYILTGALVYLFSVWALDRTVILKLLKLFKKE